MNIEFKRIEMQNFMSFAEEVFDFSECTGMNLVQGKNNDIPGAKNGCGKSQLMASLLYVLFGQLQSKIKNENIVNKYSSSKDMCLALTFSVDGEGYKVRRGLAKGKTSYLELCKLTSDGEVDITKSTIAETQSFIESELLHCDVSLFLRTILLTSDQTYNFYLLKKADKKEFVEKLFDIGVFEDMYKAIHKDSLALDRDMVGSQNRLLMLNKSLEDYESRSVKSEAAREEKVKSIKAAISKLGAELERAKQVEVKSNATEVKKLEDAIEKLREDYDASRESLLEMKSNESKIELGLHKIDESTKSRQIAVDKHKDILSKLCSDCKRVFMEHYSLGTLLSEIEDMSSKRALLEKSKSSIEKKILDTASSCEAYKSKIAKAKGKLQSMVEESSRATQLVSSIESRVRDAESSLKAAADAPNPYVELASKCRDDIAHEASCISSIERKQKYLKFAESIVSQDTLRKFIIRDLVVLLNNKIKTYLTKLGAKYYVEFDEDMEYTFIAPNGTYEWSNFSAGERMRIMVATSFAFRDFMSIRNGLNANVLVLDEYFDSAIDSLCVESIISILREYAAAQRQNIFVISHRTEVNPEMFDRTILVEKTNNVSSVKFTR